jgi:hypothetical protein
MNGGSVGILSVGSIIATSTFRIGMWIAAIQAIPRLLNNRGGWGAEQNGHHVCAVGRVQNDSQKMVLSAVLNRIVLSPTIWLHFRPDEP